MPAGTMPGPPGSGVTSPTRRNRTRPIAQPSPVDAPRWARCRGDYAGVDKDSRTPILRLHDRLAVVVAAALLSVAAPAYGFPWNPGYTRILNDFGAPFGKYGGRSPTTITGTPFAACNRSLIEQSAAGFIPIAERTSHSGLSFGFSSSEKQSCAPTKRSSAWEGIGSTSIPASTSAACNWAENIAGSVSGDARTATAVTLPRSDCIASYWSSVMTRGAILVSRPMILSFWTPITFASYANNATLQSVSTIIPPITSLLAPTRTLEGPCSQIIPNPTANVASTSPAKRYTLTGSWSSLERIFPNIFPSLLLLLIWVGGATLLVKAGWKRWTAPFG